MSPKGVKCPTCRREIDWANSPYRPFCSERCRLIDLGAWLSEKHAIAGDATPIEGGGTDDERPPKDGL
jgi:uncharacterized protein